MRDEPKMSLRSQNYSQYVPQNEWIGYDSEKVNMEVVYPLKSV